jgi:hypothetical protein
MIRRLLRVVLKVIAAVLIILAVPAAVAVAYVEIGCRPDPPATGASAATRLPIDEPSYLREPANSYFSFPEWYIVYSFEDFGRFLDNHSESAFPYVSQIAGFWRSYCEANRVAGAFPGKFAQTKFNLYIIGLSFSFEYAVKGIYENTIGRLTEWLRGPTPSPEDVYARAVLQDYAHFLHEIPWYRFPFGEKLAGLWQSTPLASNSAARSIERKLSLSAEYAIKQGYANLITRGLAATSEPAPLQIMFVVKGDITATLAKEPALRLVSRLPGDLTLLEAPRYERFTELLKRLAANRVEIVEIAGNRRILVSVIAPEDVSPTIAAAAKLFTLPIDARLGFRRVGYDADISALPAILDAFQRSGIEVEHFYDY